MLHYLIAAGIGAAVSTAAYVGIQLWTGKPITWKGVAVSAVGGLVAGVLCATPGGVAALQAGGARALTFVAADGAAAAGAEKVTENLLNKKPLGEGVPEAVAWGTAAAPVAYLGLRGYTQQLRKVFFPGAAAAEAAAEAAALQAGALEATAVAGRKAARTTAVNITNAIAIAGGNPAVARVVEATGITGSHTPTTTSDTTAAPTPPAEEPVVETTPPEDADLYPTTSDETPSETPSEPAVSTSTSRGMINSLPSELP